MAKRIGISLAKMHSLNVIHGDLTTSNLMLRKEGDSVVNVFTVEYFIITDGFNVLF